MCFLLYRRAVSANVKCSRAFRTVLLPPYLCGVMVLSFLFFAFLAYLVFKLVVNFILPVYRTTRQVKRKFREMNEQMRRQQPGAPPQNEAPKDAKNKKSTLGEYIDFEEVKD